MGTVADRRLDDEFAVLVEADANLGQGRTDREIDVVVRLVILGGGLGCRGLRQFLGCRWIVGGARPMVGAPARTQARVEGVLRAAIQPRALSQQFQRDAKKRETPGQYVVSIF